MSKTRIGYIGVGLMGHGAAKNILEKGAHPLTVMGHRNRQPVDDLVRRGASESKSAAAMARESDILFFCLPSSVEVEATVYGKDGVLEGAHAGLVVVDSTTADPNSTRKIAADLKTKGTAMLDAPLGRSPKEAEAGTLSTYVGGDPATVAALRPVMELYADTIVEVGPLGSGHTLKLLNNFISIGTCAIISEAVATAAKLGVDMRKFYDVVSAGGANSKMFQMVMPWVLEGDDSNLKGPLRIAGKDMRFYTKLAEQAPAAAFIAQAVNQTLHLCNVRGHGDRFLPVLPGILAELNGAKIRDL
ncbi:MAG: NAD(P)-dependent oxidoreductase [Alphaproteobacteria bacterium]|nr:NAD(P)-dependent oxidoreductase [Alphaproteobacteria bacterium]